MKTTTFCLICAFMMCALPAHSQSERNDSVPPTCVSSGLHRLKWREVAIPIAVVGASALYTSVDWFTKQRNEVQDVLSDKGRHKTKADNYLQYAPMIAAYGLDLVGLKAEHSLKDRTIILAMSAATMGIVVNAMKYSVKERRPDSDARNSFPSGHTATAFMAAEFLRREYKSTSPWIGYAGYLVAASTGYLRIYNDRHYVNDVVAGACIGILSTKLAYWLYPKCFRKSECHSGMSVCSYALPYYSGDALGINVCLQF